MLTASAIATTDGLFAHTPPSMSRCPSTCAAGKYSGAAEVAIATSTIGIRQSRLSRVWCGVLKICTAPRCTSQAGMTSRFVLSPSSRVPRTPINALPQRFRVVDGRSQLAWPTPYSPPRCRKDLFNQFFVVGNDLARPEARAETQCDDATRRSPSDEIEGIADRDAQVLLQTRKYMCGEQRLRTPSVEGEDLEAVRGATRPARVQLPDGPAWRIRQLFPTTYVAEAGRALQELHPCN